MRFSSPPLITACRKKQEKREPEEEGDTEEEVDSREEGDTPENGRETRERIQVAKKREQIEEGGARWEEENETKKKEDDLLHGTNFPRAGANLPRRQHPAR